MEQAYKLAETIKRSMKQAEKAPSMTVDEAMDFIDNLWYKKSALQTNSGKNTESIPTLHRNNFLGELYGW